MRPRLPRGVRGTWPERLRLLFVTDFYWCYPVLTEESALQLGYCQGEERRAAGAPEEVWIKVDVEVAAGTAAVDWELTLLNKRPTRLPEAIFFSMTV